MNVSRHILMYILVAALVVLGNVWYVSDQRTVLAATVSLIGIALFVRDLDHLR